MSVEASPVRDTGPSSPLGLVGVAWGFGGVSVLLLGAIVRLVPPALEPFRAPNVDGTVWALGAVSLAFMGYFEGFRGFQRAFAPRVVSRARSLYARPRGLHVLLAPLFCMALIHATRRRLVASWLLVAMIAGLVAGVRQLAQPYRGLIDAGVVLGLGWGLVALVVFGVRALAGRPPGTPADLPAGLPGE